MKVSQEAKDEEKEDIKEWFANEKRALAQEKEDLELQHIQQMKELREQIQKLCTKSMNQGEVMYSMSFSGFAAF